MSRLPEELLTLMHWVLYNESNMHHIQKKLLELAKTNNLAECTLRRTAELIGDPDMSPGQIQHHLLQLEKRNLLFINRKNKTQRLESPVEDDRFVLVPIVGSASCGPALNYADEYNEGLLRISKQLLDKQSKQSNSNKHKYIAVRADGDSMNNASVGRFRQSINSGDFVLVDISQRCTEDGDYVLSIIGGMANIKRLKKHEEYISLESESFTPERFPPIIVDQSEDYMINGKVIAVYKNTSG